MPKVAILGDSRSLLSRTLVGYDLQQVSLSCRAFRIYREAFAERLRIIIEMSSSEWKNEVGVASRKLIAFKPEAPTEVMIRKLVDDLVTR